MIRSAITICLVPQAKAGPFVFHGDLSGSIARAAGYGFDAVEIFPPSAEMLRATSLSQMLRDRNLKLAAVGTGAGFVVHKLTLIDADTQERQKAVEFVKSIIDVAGEHGAPAIIGSMQGRHADGDRAAALDRLAWSLMELGAHAKAYGVPVLYEPLNRYETNLFNRQGDAAEFLRARSIGNVKILSDLFHMNIEEADIIGALGDVGELLGHVHFVDSNRRAAGLGHMQYWPMGPALRAIGYTGYLSAEALPLPDPETAAAKTMESFRKMLEDSRR